MTSGIAQWVRESSVGASCGIGLNQRYGSDHKLLWLWPTAVAPMRPLTWELPHTSGAAVTKKKKKKKKSTRTEGKIPGKGGVTKIHVGSEEEGVMFFAEH